MLFYSKIAVAILDLEKRLFLGRLFWNDGSRAY
jgi:hypothetical protein